jgi:hypothetical protein
MDQGKNRTLKFRVCLNVNKLSSILWPPQILGLSVEFSRGRLPFLTSADDNGEETGGVQWGGSSEKLMYVEGCV